MSTATSTRPRAKKAPAPERVGRTEPRLWTRPLRELTPETSLGFEVIEFALVVLGIDLYPWQQWLLIHLLELLEDGTYRFRRVVVLVGRQNGKTTLAAVLAAWWLFVDSARHPDRVPPLKFKVVGVAQNLDIAREPWAAVKLWCDPKPETDEEAALAVDSLQTATAKVMDTNGKESIVARSRAHYEIRAAKNARGKPASKVLMDEMREQRDWSAWNAVSQTTKSFWNGMLVALSNAGDAGSVVLAHQRNAALLDLIDAGFEIPDYVDRGVSNAEAFANGEDFGGDVSLGIFEWSGVPGCEKNDLAAILQSNPSIGFGAMTVEICLADIRGMTDAGYRTEVLCQWVTSLVDSFIDVKDWKGQHVAISEVSIPLGSRTVWGVATSADRKRTWIAAAVFTSLLDGEGNPRPFVTARIERAGMMWVPEYLAELAQASGHREVAIQGKGVPAVEFIEPLKKLGLIVHELEAVQFALGTGRMSDRVRDKKLVIVEQPQVDAGIAGGVTMKYGGNKAWDPWGSLPVDIAGVVAESNALYALELLEPPPPEPTPPPPPQAEMVTRADIMPGDENLATAQF